MRVAVVAGGLSHERDVSVRSGRRVSDALRRQGVAVELWDFDVAFLSRLQAHEVDAAFVVLHGGAGENGTVQAILELAGVPHSGATSHACRSAFDKAVAKARLAEAGIATPAWTALPSATFRDLGAAAVNDLLVASLGLPLVVKPVTGGSSLGVTLVDTAAELAPALVAAFSYGVDALIERQMTGAEVAVPVLERGGSFVPLQPVLVETSAGQPYDYQARYDASSGVRYTHLLDEDPDFDVPALRALAARVHEVLGLRGLSRVDIRFDAGGTANVLEAAVTPGMTETSIWPMAIARAGLDLGQVCLELSRAATVPQPS
ncbi:MAG: D-alanine--D-alanine ligase [Actinomycetota bacterium]|nr:D-alanine--D-alanine ligase [Actinomycetota bacterium]